MDTKLILARFGNVCKQGKSWSAACPAHDDTRSSLSIAVGDNGGTVLHCHAGCSAEAIVKAVGLTMRDLMPPQSDTHGSKPTKPKKSPKAAKAAMPKGNEAGDEAEEKKGCAYRSQYLLRIHAMTNLLGKYGQGVALAGTWQYPDFFVDRWNLPTPARQKQAKEFRPYYTITNEAGTAWYFGYPSPTSRKLYHVNSLDNANDTSMVVVCAGEKAADAAVSVGFVATTNAGGEGAIDQSDWSPVVRFLSVVIVTDNDAAGPNSVVIWPRSSRP